MLESFDHAIVAVRDLGAASERYAALLGRRPSWHGVHPGLGTANALFRLDNTYLELIAPASEGSFVARLHRRLETHGEGMFGIAFGISDAEDAARELRARGLWVPDPVPGEGRDERTGAVRRWGGIELPESPMRGLLAFAIEHRSPADALPRAELDAPPEQAVHALDHVVVQTSDPDAALRLYRDVLGIRLALDRSFPSFGARLLFFRIAGITVEIAAKLGAVPDPDTPDRLGGLAWNVPDADAARRRLAAAGFDVSEVRAGRKPGTRVCTVRDGTHGVPTLLIGRD